MAASSRWRRKYRLIAIIHGSNQTTFKQPLRG